MKPSSDMLLMLVIHVSVGYFLYSGMGPFYVISKCKLM